jgi:hypothetical protein
MDLTRSRLPSGAHILVFSVDSWMSCLKTDATDNAREDAAFDSKEGDIPRGHLTS